MREAKFIKPLSVALSPNLYAKIKDLADERRISMAQLIREIAEEGLRNLDRKEGFIHGCTSSNRT